MKPVNIPNTTSKAQSQQIYRTAIEAIGKLNGHGLSNDTSKELSLTVNSGVVMV